MDNKNKDLDLRHSILRFYPEQVGGRARRLSKVDYTKSEIKQVKTSKECAVEEEKGFEK